MPRSSRSSRRPRRSRRPTRPARAGRTGRSCERPATGDLAATKEELRKQVLAKKINGYLVLEPAKLEKEEVEYYSTTVSDFIALNQLAVGDRPHPDAPEDGRARPARRTSRRSSRRAST